MIALEERERFSEAEAEPLFSPSISAAIVAVGVLVFVVVLLSARGSHTVLLTPVDAQVQATLIAFGVFAGVWVAAIIREFWPVDGEADTLMSTRFPLVVRLLGVVAAGGWCGFVIADRTTEWRAFHGVRAPAVLEGFTVTDVSTSRRGSKTLHLVGPSGAPSISIGCEVQDCRGLAPGDRLSVRVETGRGGARRAIFPAAVSGRAARG